ncbi:MAG: hypothetical protein PHE53_07095 [Thermoguttaceae bacterium]|nr:hypothetical protein [Thermoguttaceae bacterium]
MFTQVGTPIGATAAPMSGKKGEPTNAWSGVTASSAVLRRVGITIVG